jgi:hypothetical protein
MSEVRMRDVPLVWVGERTEEEEAGLGHDALVRGELLHHGAQNADVQEGPCSAMQDHTR